MVGQNTLMLNGSSCTKRKQQAEKGITRKIKPGTMHVKRVFTSSYGIPSRK
jgi:hypothetical protein